MSRLERIKTESLCSYPNGEDYSNEEGGKELEEVNELITEYNHFANNHNSLLMERDDIQNKFEEGILTSSEFSEKVTKTINPALEAIGCESFDSSLIKPRGYNELSLGVEGVVGAVGNAIVWLYKKIKEIVVAIIRRFKILWETSFGRTRKQMKSIEQLIDESNKLTPNPQAGNIEVQGNMALYLRVNQKIEVKGIMTGLENIRGITSDMLINYPARYDDMIKSIASALNNYSPEGDHSSLTDTIRGYCDETWLKRLANTLIANSGNVDGMKVFKTKPFMGDKVMVGEVAADLSDANTLADVISRGFNKMRIYLDDASATRLTGSAINTPLPNEIRQILLTLKSICEIKENYSTSIQKRLSVIDKIEDQLKKISKTYGGQSADRDTSAVINLLPRLTTQYQEPCAKFDMHIKKVIDVTTAFCRTAISRHTPQTA